MKRYASFAALLAILMPSLLLSGTELRAELKTAVQLTNPNAVDQDDMCIWIHPEERSQSTIITSDKEANSLFVYSLAGKLLQTIPVAGPGNIDIRQNATITHQQRSLVVVNERAANRLAAFFVDPNTRKLSRCDRQDIRTGENYGGCLHLSRDDQSIWFISTSKQSGIEVIQLESSADDSMRGNRVRKWSLGKCEGAVSDDSTGTVYVSVEREGIYAFNPLGETQPQLVVQIGANGFQGDAEGIALFQPMDSQKSLIVSDQGASQFRIYQPSRQFHLLGAVSNPDAKETDGIEIALGAFNKQFPNGIFACHSDIDAGKTILLSDAGPILRLAISGQMKASQ